MCNSRPRFHFAIIILAILAATGVFGGNHAHAAPLASDRIAVTVSGQGPDVVLIPGLASSGAVWDATVKQLSGRYRVHVVQVAGFAGAPAGGNAEGPMLEPLVEAVDRYIKSAGLMSPAVIGHSMGGLTGLMLARRHPEALSRLMIVDSLPFYPVLFSPAATVEGVRPQATAMRDGMSAMSAETFAAQQAMTMPRLVKSPEGLKAALDWSRTSSQPVVARALYDVLTTDMRGELAAVTTPTTMLYPYDPAMGAPQAMVDQTYAGAYASLAGVRLERVDGAFHFIMLDQSAAFAAAVERFLK
ncbi:alpha/beta fold hydrolase [Caulobacter sp. ErkDOM-E]|uniref:alpha/beta fold hydrolase n=1 Tax=Caulobacter sp. ErkDOM-E TaxID=3402778 RepID=UPI003AF7BDD8